MLTVLQLTNRTGMVSLSKDMISGPDNSNSNLRQARMDVVHGRQTANGRRNHAAVTSGVGTEGACSQYDCHEERFQDLQYVCLDLLEAL